MNAIKFCFIIKLVCLHQILLFSQLNQAIYNFTKSTDDLNINVEKSLNSKSIKLNEIPCDKNYFWGLYDGNVEQFSILNGNIISEGIANSNCPGYSLAVSDNLDGGFISPTFYSSHSSVAYYYNDSNWIQTAQFSPFNPLFNSGGNGFYLYFLQEQFPYGFIKYDGNNFSLFYSSDSLYSSMADLVVDNDGNIWILTKNNNSTYNSQQLDVISPSGVFIKRYYINIIDTYHAYGAFMLNDTLYVGLGEFNPVYPNTLLPIIIYPDTAILGTPLSMPQNNYEDLASCNVGSPLSKYNNLKISNFKCYPNPASNKVTLYSNNNDNINSVSITDLTGRIVFISNYKGGSNQRDIDISGLQSGNYIISVKIGNNVINRKLLINR